jgi:hypothetical protein
LSAKTPKKTPAKQQQTGRRPSGKENTPPENRTEENNLRVDAALPAEETIPPFSSMALNHAAAVANDLVKRASDPSGDASLNGFVFTDSDEAENAVINGFMVSQLVSSSRCMTNEAFKSMFELLLYWEDRVFVLSGLPELSGSRLLEEAKFRGVTWGRRVLQLRKSILLGWREGYPAPPGEVIYDGVGKKRALGTEEDNDEEVSLTAPKRFKA